jgi:hypothetical protein
MALSNLSSAQLAQLIRLVKERETLQAQLDRVTSSLTALEGGEAPKRRGRKPGRPAKVSSGRGPGRPPGRPAGSTGKRGKRLKQPLLKILKAAGASGITVKDLAAKLKVKPNNVFSWFYTTGKKVSGIKKVGEAKYSFAG